VEVERFASRVLETSYEGNRYVVVFSASRERRDVARLLQLLAKIETGCSPSKHASSAVSW
jgi:hypothetical protein